MKRAFSFLPLFLFFLISFGISTPSEAAPRPESSTPSDSQSKVTGETDINLMEAPQLGSTILTEPLVKSYTVFTDYNSQNRFGSREKFDLRRGTGVQFVELKEVPIGLFMNDSGYIDSSKKYCATNPGNLYVYFSENDLNKDGVTNYQDTAYWNSGETRMDVMVQNFRVNSGGVLLAQLDVKIQDPNPFPDYEQLKIFFDPISFHPCDQFPQPETHSGDTVPTSDIPRTSGDDEDSGELVDGGTRVPAPEDPLGSTDDVSPPEENPDFADVDVSGDSENFVPNKIQTGESGAGADDLQVDVQGGGSVMGCSILAANFNSSSNVAGIIFLLPLLLPLISKKNKA